MNTKIDLKSLLLGLGLGVIATVAVGAASSPGQVGRFQIGGTSNYGMVIDTATGQVWSTFVGSSSTAGVGNKDFYQQKLGENN